MKIERVWSIMTPEEKERADLEYYRNLTPQQRLDELFELINAWTDPADRRIERTYRVVSVPLPGERCDDNDC